MVDAVRTQGRVAFERGDLVTAERVLEQSLSMSEDVRPAFALVSQLSLSRVWLADGRVGEALSGVERARAFLRPDSTSPLLSLCHALEGRIAIEIGDLDRATRCAQSLQPGNRASLLQARIELARSEPDRADDALARCTPATMRERLDVALLSARVAHIRKSDAADPLLAEALAVAKIEGFVVAVTDDLVELRPRVTLLLRSGRIDRERVHRPAGKGAVEIDHVQVLEPLRSEGARLRRRIEIEHGRARHVALFEAHALAVLQVDRGKKDHGFHFRKFEISARPKRWLFSG